MSLIAKQNNACALSAAHTIRNDLPEEEILAVFTRHGYDAEGGTNRRAIRQALEDLGVEYEVVYAMGLPTTAKFCREQGKEGVWYVTTRTHAFAIINGQPVDPYYKRTMMRGRITFSLKIHNPVLSPRYSVSVADQLELLKHKYCEVELLAKPQAKNRGSQRFERYAAIYETHGGIGGTISVHTAKEWFSYSRTDLAWDVKKGHVRAFIP